MDTDGHRLGLGPSASQSESESPGFARKSGAYRQHEKSICVNLCSSVVSHFAISEQPFGSA